MDEKTLENKVKILKALNHRKYIWLANEMRQFAAQHMDGEDPEGKQKLLKYTNTTLSRRVNGYEEWKPYEKRAIRKILKIKL